MGQVDREKICTVIVNLLLNALDAMPRGGSLEVRLEPSAHRGIVLSVSDTGKGIASEIAAHLFQPFNSSKPTGSGLGLSISKRVIEEHGGSITGNNRLDGGAQFTITLPQPVREDHYAAASGR